jgi:hypothetical protein
LFPAVKLLEHDIDHLLPFGAEVKNECSYSSAPPVCIWDVDMDSVAFKTLQFDKTYSFKFSKHILSVLQLLEPELYVFFKELRLGVGPMHPHPHVEWVPRVFSSVVK